MTPKERDIRINVRYILTDAIVRLEHPKGRLDDPNNTLAVVELLRKAKRAITS